MESPEPEFEDGYREDCGITDDVRGGALPTSGILIGETKGFHSLRSHSPQDPPCEMPGQRASYGTFAAVDCVREHGGKGEQSNGIAFWRRGASKRCRRQRPLPLAPRLASTHGPSSVAIVTISRFQSMQ
jgi:hypothetical protein